MKDVNCAGNCPLCTLNPEESFNTAAALPPQPEAKEPAVARQFPSVRLFKLTDRSLLLGIAALLFIAGLIYGQRLPLPYPQYWLYIPAYLLAGWKVIWSALKNLFQGRVLDEYFLMTLASGGAIAIGELPEAVAVMLFFNVGQLLEDAAVNRSRRSIAALMEIRPDFANLVTEKGEERKVDPEEVVPGQTILVKPGERIPLDGIVEWGDSFVDNSTLTGESLPVRIEQGSKVLAGGVNSSGLLCIKVSRAFGESSLSRILKLVQEAAGRKAKTEQFITVFARYYTPAVVVAAGLLAVLPPLLLPNALFSEWLYRALVLLVISCPCALVISIPLGYFGGIGSASKNGILVKGANFLEALLKVKTVVFDKTGTLTEGSFKVAKVYPEPGFTEESLLKWAVRAEHYAAHPIARAIREAYQEAVSAREIESYEEIRGLGVKARIDGKEVLAGSSRLLEKEGVELAVAAAAGSAVYLSVDGQYAGYLLVRDELKEDAAFGIRRLKELGVEKVIMLTGDREETAAETAHRAGIDSYFAELLPEEKVQRLEELLEPEGQRERGGRQRGKLAFVGDGINDAPALSRADVGIAMGGLGADAAIEAADVVIMDDRPSRVARAVEIASFTRKIVVQNIILALGVKGFFVIMGIFGLASIWEAVFADVGVAVLAILNATRALKN